jgi:NAD(P)-dependent dehydrogenase (short-subunit alcohol dehydrogenase family)
VSAALELALAGGGAKAGAGARVAVLDRDPWRDQGQDRGDGIAAPAASLIADMRDTAAVDAAMAAVADTLGGIDGLVYRAGIDLLTTLAATRDEDWTRLLDINLTGAMRACRAALRPGAVETVRERYALHRIAEPDEMARCILFLTSAASSYVTGTALAADGGRSFH